MKSHSSTYLERKWRHSHRPGRRAPRQAGERLINGTSRWLCLGVRGDWVPKFRPGPIGLDERDFGSPYRIPLFGPALFGFGPDDQCLSRSGWEVGNSTCRPGVRSRWSIRGAMLMLWNMNVIFHIILGISSSQLTKSMIFQRGRAQPPTRCHIWSQMSIDVPIFFMG